MNLHRADLTELQRKEQIAEWIAITEAEQREGVLAQLEPKPRGGRPETGIRAAARELGVERNEAQRAVKVASISERAKQAAVDAKLDNNQSALLKVARAAPEQQEAVVREIVAERAERKAKANKGKSSGSDEVTTGPPSIRHHHYHATADDHVSGLTGDVPSEIGCPWLADSRGVHLVDLTAARDGAWAILENPKMFCPQACDSIVIDFDLLGQFLDARLDLVLPVEIRERGKRRLPGGELDDVEGCGCDRLCDGCSRRYSSR